MTNQEITEGNKLIAEFMGAKCHKGIGDLKIYTYAKFQDESDKCGITLRIDLLEYHKKWDNWLMPVVEKIESLGHKFGIIQNIVTVSSPEYVWNGGTTSESKIKCVWYGVVEFIKWYNQNK